MPTLLRDTPGWPGLAAHALSCADQSCGCKSFVEHFDDWAPQLTDGGDTWLYYCIANDGEFGWMCLLCDGDMGGRRIEPVISKHAGPCKLSNLKQHAESNKHKKNVAKYMDASVQVSHSGPPIPLFVELIEAFRRGVAPSAGYELGSGLLDKDKAVKMLWCASEALADMVRNFLWRSETLNLSRDERHGRLHARFRSVGDDCVLHRGSRLIFLSQPKSFC